MKIWICILFVVFLAGAKAQEKPVYSSREGAASGYDVVAYFNKKTPTKGLEKHSTDYKGATWLFSTKENLDAFIKDPEAYVPQYGGYCAYAVSKGYVAKSDPDAWKIVNGKLYLNYNLKVKGIWEENQSERIKSADANWPQVLKN